MRAASALQTLPKRPAMELSLGDSVRAALRCPACRGALHETPPTLGCACGMSFPVVNGVPILFDRASTLIDVDACQADFQRQPGSGPRDRLRALFPDISANTASRANY